MARLVFTQQLARLTEIPELEVQVPTLRAALDAAFAVNPRLRGYILDEQGHLRANVAVFIDGLRVRERMALDQPVGEAGAVHVMQALSGG
jgi:sulfur-carrier protein